MSVHLFLPVVSILLQEGRRGGGAFSSLCGVIFAILMIVAIWKLFEKAKEPGWASIIPIYNALVYLKIVGRPWWWILLLLIPVVNIVIVVILAFDAAKAFGKSTLFGLGLLLLAPIF